jgi:hypothetical protein
MPHCDKSYQSSAFHASHDFREVVLLLSALFAAVRLTVAETLQESCR